MHGDEQHADLGIDQDIAQAFEHAVAVIVGESASSDGPVIATNPGMPPLKEQSGLPSASAVARKKYGALSMNARSSGVNCVRVNVSRRSEIRRLSN